MRDVDRAIANSEEPRRFTAAVSAKADSPVILSSHQIGCPPYGEVRFLSTAKRKSAGARSPREDKGLRRELQLLPTRARPSGGGSELLANPASCSAAIARFFAIPPPRLLFRVRLAIGADREAAGGACDRNSHRFVPGWPSSSAEFSFPVVRRESRERKRRQDEEPRSRRERGAPVSLVRIFIYLFGRSLLFARRTLILMSSSHPRRPARFKEYAGNCESRIR